MLLNNNQRKEPVDLALARYRLNFRVTQPVQLPDYAGSALRGAFGHALMQLSGLRKHDVREKTPLFLFSPYAQIFEPQPDATATGLSGRLPTPPVPYVIEAPLGGARYLDEGEEFSFALVLLEPALQHLSLIILAWRRALLRGFGRGEGGTAELLSVQHLSGDEEVTTLYTEERPLVQTHQTTVRLPEFELPRTLHLQLETPLRLQLNGRVLSPAELTAPVFLRHLIRRVSLCFPALLNHERVQSLNVQADAVADERHLHHKPWARFSSRQRKLMQMDGAVGDWLLLDVPPTLQQLLWLGQFLHLGKGTAYGLGGYRFGADAWKT